MSIDPYQLALGAALGVVGTISVRWWQYQRDLWLGEVERFCDTLDGAAECATEYWLREKPDAGLWEDQPSVSVSSEETSAHRDIELYEARLMGFQIRLDGLSASITDRLSHVDGVQLNKNMEGMSDALTGGDYGSAARVVDRERAQLAQVYASDMIVDVRRGLARSLSLRGTATYAWENLQKRHIAAHATER